MRKLDSRALLIASYRPLLHSYVQSLPAEGPSKPLLNLLSSPRAQLVDLSYLDLSSGRALLHEATRRRDLRLIDLSVRAGADIFIRDRRGKSVGESSKDESCEEIKEAHKRNEGNHLRIRLPATCP